MKYFLVGIGAIWMFCQLCGCAAMSSTPPVIQTQGSGTYIVEKNGEAQYGDFSYNGFTCVITPHCTDCASVQFVFDGQRYAVSACDISAEIQPQAFPRGSFYRLLPSVFTALSVGSIPLTYAEDSWCFALQSADGLINGRVDMDGNIIELAFHALNRRLTLQYDPEY